MKIINLKPIQQTVIKGKNRNTRKSCEVCSKLTIKTPPQNFTQLNLNSGSAQAQFMPPACQRLVMVRISDNGPVWK